MKYESHEYQRYATEFILEHTIAAIFLQMGLGKTVITLTALRQLPEAEGSLAGAGALLRAARDTWRH